MESAPTFTDYDSFARAYDRHWGGGVRHTLPLIQKLLLARLPAGSRVLDLCCGTGQFLRILLDLGYQAVGLDGSSAQLSCARKHAPGAELVNADARSFDIAEPFAGVVSLNDSLNHVMTVEELTAVFRNVRAVLPKGGVFVFDLNMAHKYETAWSGTFSFVDRDLVTVVRSSADLSTKVALFDATVFEKHATVCWRRSDVSLRQTWYSEGEVTGALQAAGFVDVHVHPRSADKTFFVAL
jgi:SAM-dependent methyltransferase